MKIFIPLVALGACAALLVVCQYEDVSVIAHPFAHPVPAALAVRAEPVHGAARPVLASASTKNTLHEVESAVAAARARGADDNEVYRLRAAQLPARTIAMLGEREQAEKAWTARVRLWQTESARLQGDAAALQALQERLFSKEEQGRLGATTESATPQLRFD